METIGTPLSSNQDALGLYFRDSSSTRGMVPASKVHLGSRALQVAAPREASQNYG